MRNIIRNTILIANAMLLMAACDDSTADLGIFPSTDGLTYSTQLFELTSRSVKMDSVVANSTLNYVGRITDPETGFDITADFAAQFYSLEDYRFPSKSLMIGDVDGVPTHGVVQCDSCEVRLYFDKYYGDPDNPLKLEVYQLSQEQSKIMSEDSVFYTDIDLTQFLTEGAKPIASRIVTPRDYNVPTATLESSGYTQNIRIALPNSIGQHIMDKYYEARENNDNSFADAYHFIRKVFPGLYFKATGGKGTLLAVHVGALNIYYRMGDVYYEDTVYNSMSRFAATPEVIQSTHFDNENLDSLLADNTCTYLKTPAGICTEITLPVDDIFSNEHNTDSLSMASVTLTRYNKPQDKYQLGTPSELLMVRKADMHSFFLDHRVADGRTSYTTSFASASNSYTFGNICRLISYCKHEKLEAMQQRNKERQEAGLAPYSESEWDTQWQSENPDWNKVVIIPVVTSNATVMENGVNMNTQVSVTHDLSLNSIRLIGGDTKIKMQVVYSRFFQK